MPTALYAFENRDEAERAIQRLVDHAGFPQAAVQLHMHDEIGADTAGEIDEIVTGGFLHSFSHLWQGVFDAEIAPAAANPYADAIRRGGAVVRVEADDTAACDRADAVMAEFRPATGSGWHEGMLR